LDTLCRQAVKMVCSSLIPQLVILVICINSYSINTGVIYKYAVLLYQSNTQMFIAGSRTPTDEFDYDPTTGLRVSYIANNTNNRQHNCCMY